MKWFRNKYFITMFWLLCHFSGVLGQNIPQPMNPPRLLNDFAGIFSDSQNAALEQKLRAYNDSTSTQIYVVTVNDLGGYPASDFAFKLGEEWGIGQKAKTMALSFSLSPRRQKVVAMLLLLRVMDWKPKLTMPSPVALFVTT